MYSIFIYIFLFLVIFKYDNLEKSKLVKDTSELNLNVNDHGNQDFDESIEKNIEKTW